MTDPATIRFTIHGAAMPKERARARIVTPKGKKPFISHYTPKETADFEKRVKALARAVWPYDTPSERPIELQLTVYIEIPQSWPGWKVRAAERAELVPTGKPDLDNLEKAIADAMNGVVYKDDAQIISSDKVKMYAPPGVEGFTEVAVRESWRAPSSITNRDGLP